MTPFSHGLMEHDLLSGFIRARLQRQRTVIVDDGSCVTRCFVLLPICHAVRVTQHEIGSVAFHGLALDIPYKGKQKKQRGGVG